MASADAFAESWNSVDRTHIRAFDVVPDLWEFVGRNTDEHGKEVVFRFERKDDASLRATHVHLEILGLDVLPVGKVVAEDRWDLVVYRCIDEPREARIPSVGANRDRGAFLHSATVRASAAHADHYAIVDKVLVDTEPFAHLCATRGRGIEEDLVQRRASGPYAQGNPSSTMPRMGRGKSPKSAIAFVTAGVRAAMWLRMPHARKRRGPCRCTKCPCGMSLGNAARSTRSTFAPRRASSIANGEPAQRAPTTRAW